MRTSTAVLFYRVSDWGMAAVIRGIASELGKFCIRGDAVAPGYTKTAFMHDAAASKGEHLDALVASNTPNFRLGEINDFAGFGAYRRSRASCFHRGQMLVTSGVAPLHSP